MGIVRYHSRWFAFRARIAIVATLVQALIPFLLAAEIDHAVAGNLPICSVGDHFDGRSPGSPSDRHKTGDSGTCPICVALHASLAFAAPFPIAVPVPGPAISLAQAGTRQPRPRVFTAASYRSRAPPIT